MEVVVNHESGHRFAATCRGHTVTTGKGEDGNESRDGMWPAQLFEAAIGMCIGGYIAEFCKEHNQRKSERENRGWLAWLLSEYIKDECDGQRPQKMASITYEGDLSWSVSQ